MVPKKTAKIYSVTTVHRRNLYRVLKASHQLCEMNV